MADLKEERMLRDMEAVQEVVDLCKEIEKRNNKKETKQ